jgi:hypothetical protein
VICPNHMPLSNREMPSRYKILSLNFLIHTNRFLLPSPFVHQTPYFYIISAPSILLNCLEQIQHHLPLIIVF